MTLKPGWLRRQFDHVSAEVAAWPEWMRREAGMTGSYCLRCGYHRNCTECTNAMPIDWKARCEAAERELEQLRAPLGLFDLHGQECGSCGVRLVTINGRPALTDPAPDEIAVCGRCAKHDMRELERELAEIKGRREWGLEFLGIYTNGRITPVGNEQWARAHVAKWPDYALRVRYQAGPWEKAE